MKFEYEKHSNAPVKTEDLLTDLKRVAKEEQKVSQSIYAKKGRYDCSTIIRRFGSWNKALKKAEIALANEINISDERLYENLLNLWQRLGRQPRRSDLTSKFSEFSQSPYNRRFKTWSNALKSFVEYANSQDKKVKGSTHQEDSARRAGRDPSLRLRFKVMKRDNFSCRSCGDSLAKNSSVILHVDHIKAWANGWETVLENLQTLCSKCNIGKSNVL
ncbi:MAG TPA: HNH endonuclease [Candidatus Omnitrophota bacterium]|nr:HNH endonuclease [Candidatus Omnitrophota bacterium]HPN56434.1 HNH endonuclease [Candidatus Omnitrophota bacterium]